jgi:Tol biopolymer transport system component
MKWLWRIITAVLILALAAAIWFLYFRIQPVPVSPADLTPEIVTPPSSASATLPVDSRLEGLPERADGARLLWDNPDRGAILGAAFADSGSFVISATDPAGYRVFALDLATRQVAHELDSATSIRASASRPVNRNADAFCYSGLTSPRNTLEIWCRNYAWENPRRLTSHDGPENLVSPTISPDGSVVTFEVIAPATRKSSETIGTIWSIGLDGTGIKQLTRGADDRSPTWSDDGARIYFQRHLPDGSWDIYSMGADGTNPTPVLQTYAQDERGPVVVPQTSQIAFVESSSDTPARVRLLNVLTKAGEWLTGENLGPESFVSISPDGQLAGLVAPVDASSTSTRMGVWLMSLEPKS